MVTQNFSLDILYIRRPWKGKNVKELRKNIGKKVRKVFIIVKRRDGRR